MTNMGTGYGYGGQAGETGGSGTYEPTPRQERPYTRPAAAYGGATVATGSYGRDTEHKRFPWAILAILCVLAVLFVIGICKYGLKDTVPYSAPPTPVATTVYVAPPAISHPLPRNG
jgi:hypothetical protein